MKLLKLTLIINQLNMESTQSISITFSNINHDRRGGLPFNRFCSHLFLKERIPNIVREIIAKLAKGRIVGIFEIQRDNAKILIECMETTNYVIGQYNNSSSSIMYVVFYPERISVKNVWNKALTADSIVNGYELKS